MLIQDSVWEFIRGQFSEEEKATLRGVVQGQAICPPGTMIDEDRLDEGLRDKLTAAMRGRSQAAG